MKKKKLKEIKAQKEAERQKFKKQTLKERISESIKESKENGVIKQYFEYYKKHLKLKRIIFLILMIVVFCVTISLYISNLNEQDFIKQMQEIGQNGTNINAFSKILENLPLVILIIFSGFTPFVFIPVLGIGTGYLLARNIITLTYSLGNSHSLIIMCIGAIIQLIGYSLAVSIGTSWCVIATKRFIYRQSSDYSLADIKRHFYELKEDKKKLNELEEKRKLKLEKAQKYNEKVPYVTIFITFLISAVEVLLGTIIFYI